MWPAATRGASTSSTGSSTRSSRTRTSSTSCGCGPTTSEALSCCTAGAAPAARRRGVARALARAVVDKAAAHGGTSVWLEVLSTNRPATLLRGDLGFSEVERVLAPFPSRPDADDLRMARRTTAA
ncbi:GNAT family N-acetyltransferase [Mobilicoccus pelagius]|uniref:GNAT family N-acetyltransferase n=1 Tax=Mobilicoccus pelagius TaxID=746032 RepID=UPI0009FD59AE